MIHMFLWKGAKLRFNDFYWFFYSLKIFGISFYQFLICFVVYVKGVLINL